MIRTDNKAPIFLTQLALLSSFIFLFTNCNKIQSSQQELEDKLAKIISVDQHRSLSSIDSMLNISKNDYDSGILFFEKGNIYLTNSDYEYAIKNFNKSLILLNKLKIENLYFLRANLGLGIANSMIGNKALATDYLLQALVLSKKLDNKEKEAKIYNILAHTYFQYKDYEDAIVYTQKAIALYKAKKDSIGLSETFNNLAVIYKNMNNTSYALFYNQKSLKLNQQQNDPKAIAKSYNNLGQVYNMLRDKKNAILYYQKAIKTNAKHGILNAKPLINIGYLYIHENDLEKARDYLDKAFAISLKTESIIVQKKVASRLLNIALQNKNFKRSLRFQAINDSLQIIKDELENNEHLRLSKSQHNLANKKTEIEQLKAINFKNQIIFVTIFISLIILALFIIQRLKNKELKLQKEKIDLESKVLRTQMNPHFIFNALSAIQNSLLDNDSIKSATYLSRFAKLIRQNFDFISQQKISLSDELDALENYIYTQKIRFIDKFEYEVIVDKAIDIDTIKIPPLLLQPLIENTIEHGFKNKKDKGLIQIIIKKDGEHSISYQVVDNGKGFSKFKKDDNPHSLDILKKRLQILDAKQDLLINSTTQGTHIKFSIPHD